MIAVYYAPNPATEQKGRHQLEHELGRRLLAQGLREQQLLSCSPEALEEKLAFGEHGKPYLPGHPDIHFNISHCPQMVVCGLADQPLGVDVETIRDFPDTILRRVLTQTEQEFLEQFRETPALYQEYFYRFWTLKESLIKATGTGLSVALTDVSFQLSTEGPWHVLHCSQPDYFFYQKKLGVNQVLSVCTREKDPDLFIIYSFSI